MNTLKAETTQTKMGPILYLHGFNSGPGEKSIALAKEFPGTKIITPQMKDNNVLDNSLMLIDIVNSEKPKYIMGTSLGGFYALYLSTIFKDCFFFIINPAFSPQESLKSLIGLNLENYVTGHQYQVSPNFIQELADLSAIIRKNFDTECLLNCDFYIGKQDEVLEYTEFVAFLQSFKYPYKLRYTENDHRHGDISMVVGDLRGR